MMTLSHDVSFNFDLSLPEKGAISFVQDVKTSLSKVRFIDDLQVIYGDKTVVTANLPVNAALFGQQLLNFRSHLLPKPQGASLEALIIETDEPGWAEVSGEARVLPKGQGSQVEYRFDITIHLSLPKPERWGGHALSKMIEFTAQRVLENITTNFPKAIQEAAKEVEAAYSA